MSNAVFPTLPGLAWSIVKTPTWSTRIQQSVSGKEIRLADRLRPIWKFALTYEVLRGGSAFTEINQLIAFFNLRMGRFDSFLLSDGSDNAATAQPFGTGDGTTRTFALTHTIQGWTEPIGSTTAPTVYVAGTSTGAYTLSSDGGSVTFTTAPTAGAALTWTGTFYYRVRFEKDMLDFDQFMKDLWQLKKCELIGVI